MNIDLKKKEVGLKILKIRLEKELINFLMRNRKESKFNKDLKEIGKVI